MLIDLRVAQLLCSRVCHDLIGPVGAVNSGIELLGEDTDPAGEALGLVAQSGHQVAARLAFFRLAFGLGGGAGSRAVAEARDLAVSTFVGDRIGFDWPAEATACADGVVASGGVKLLLNLVLLAVDCLPRGGLVAVRAAPMEDGVGVALTAAGKGARLRDGMVAAMESDTTVATLSAHTVIGGFAQSLARSLGTAIEACEEKDKIRLAALLPVAGSGGG